MEIICKSAIPQFQEYLESRQLSTKKDMSDFLNRLGYEHRDLSISEMRNIMKVRNQSFIRKNMWVEKSTMRTLRAISGSIEGDRSTGWVEQLTSGHMTRRPASKAARLGNEDKPISTKFRFKPGHKFPSDRDHKFDQVFKRKSKLGNTHTVIRREPKTPEERSFAFLRQMGRDKSLGGQPFVMYDMTPYKGTALKYVPGLYMMRGRFKSKKQWPQLIKLRQFDESEKIKQVPWNILNAKKFFSTVDTKEIWRSQVEYYYKASFCMKNVLTVTKGGQFRIR